MAAIDRYTLIGSPTQYNLTCNTPLTLAPHSPQPTQSQLIKLQQPNDSESAYQMNTLRVKTDKEAPKVVFTYLNMLKEFIRVTAVFSLIRLKNGEFYFHRRVKFADVNAMNFKP